jgi:hypothetical protein
MLVAVGGWVNARLTKPVNEYARNAGAAQNTISEPAAQEV